MNCGRSSSVEWKLPKLQRRVRFPSPAPAPPGHAPGGFVMPTSHPPSTECGGTIGATLSPHELRPAVPVQNSPSSSCTVPLPVQNSPSTPKISQFGAFYAHRANFVPFLSPTSRAWRILSRYHQQQDRHATTPGTKLAQQAQKRRIWGVLSAQGELFRARHGNYSKSKRSRPLRRTHIVHVKPPARMLSFGSKLLKPTTPLRASPS